MDPTISYTKEVLGNTRSDSRIWIYQADRKLHTDEIQSIHDQLKEFLHSWKAHGSPMKAKANIFYNYFIVIEADESEVQAGGCSIDSCTHFIQHIGKQFDIDFFKRTKLAFRIDNEIELFDLANIGRLIENGVIHETSQFYNNSITSGIELKENWLVAVKDSWLRSRLHR